MSINPSTAVRRHSEHSHDRMRGALAFGAVVLAMLPAVLDPWAGHALFEAANLARQAAGSKVWLVSLGPKAKLQQVMMTVAQKVPFEFGARHQVAMQPAPGPGA